MTKGFLIPLEKEEDKKLAYFTALSIKATQSINNVSLITKNNFEEDYRYVFDEIEETKDITENLLFTPYEETIVIKPDTMLNRDLYDWWEFFNFHNIWLCTSAKDYRNEEIKEYRDVFIQNELPSVFSNLIFFNKQSEESKDLLELLYNIKKNFETFSREFLIERIPDEFDDDIVLSLAYYLNDFDQNMIEPVKDDLSLVRMDPKAQKWKKVFFNDWMECVPYNISPDLELKVNNFKQNLPFVFKEPNFVTDKLISYYEERVEYGK